MTGVSSKKNTKIAKNASEVTKNSYSPDYQNQHESQLANQIRQPPTT